MDIKKKIKRIFGSIYLSMVDVEKSVFGQSNKLETVITQERRQSQGTLADSLKQGVLTEEVKNLRWRNYKILDSAQDLSITGFDEKGLPIISRKNKNNLSKIKQDSFDSYPLELVFINELITIGANDMFNTNINYTTENTDRFDENGVLSGRTHGSITNDEHLLKTKGSVPLVIGRDCLPKFEIETYTNKLHVRKINDTERLLEFFISVYPDENNKSSTLFNNDLKKMLDGVIVNADTINLKTVSFVSDNSIGVSDNLKYEYSNIIFDKIVLFNGFYVIKFKADVSINGDYIMEEFRMLDLDKKYENKERKW